MKLKALVSFAGMFTANAGQEFECDDDATAKSLVKAGMAVEAQASTPLADTPETTQDGGDAPEQTEKDEKPKTETPKDGAAEVKTDDKSDNKKGKK